MKKIVIILTLIVLISSTSLVFASNGDIFDKYGIRKNLSQKTLLKKPFELEAKDNVVIDKEWIVKFNQEIQINNIFSMSIKKGSNYKPVNIEMVSETEIKIIPVNDYDYNTKYSVNIALKNGNHYKMDFNTVKEADLIQPIVMVSIDNHNKAISTGINEARIVYESEVAPGISRYLAGFDVSAGINDYEIGPIRSSRIHFVDLSKSHYGGLAHAGGSIDALHLMSNSGIIDIDEIYNSNKYFFRDQNLNAPHNLFTRYSELRQKMVNEGLDKKAKKVDIYPRGIMDGGKENNGPSIEFSNELVRFKYNERNNNYERYENVFLDRQNDGSKITANNVVVLDTTYTTEYVPYPVNEIKKIPQVIGSNSARLYIDGKMWTGTWKKESENDNIKFLVNGKKAKFKEGNIWIIYKNN